MVSEFHGIEVIYISVFFLMSHAGRVEQKLNMLEMCRARLFCFDRMKSFRKSTRLFLSYTETIVG